MPTCQPRAAPDILVSFCYILRRGSDLPCNCSFSRPGGRAVAGAASGGGVHGTGDDFLQRLSTQPALDSLSYRICCCCPHLASLRLSCILLWVYRYVALRSFVRNVKLGLISPLLVPSQRRVSHRLYHQSADQNKKTLAFFLLGAMAETSLESLSGQASSLMQVLAPQPSSISFYKLYITEKL